MASSSPSSLSLSPLSSLPRIWKHQVFPSFHGADVRKSFLSHILKEFRSKGISPFIDNDIERNKSIGPELIEAIKGSKIGIVLLSKNYASSSWCLNELVEIMKSRTEIGQTVMTIFYEVDPTDVKKQKRDFGKAFRKTCKGKTNEEIETWKKALEGVATIAGYHSNNWDNEAVMIEKIATDVSNMLNNSTPRDFGELVGMGAHMENMISLLRLDLDEVRMIGIWGLPGIGKSTIARFLFNQFSSTFQLSTIMVNIKGCYPRPCLDEYSAQLKLQNQMLSQMINQKDIMIPHLGVAQERLRDKKVLLILDDVDQLGQLDALAKESRWFGHGSRIIITTEDLRILNAHGINHVYKVNFPSMDEALEIFCTYAFGQKCPKDSFTNLSQEVTFLAGRLPLGLKVMGSYFRGMSEQEWTKSLPKLRSRLDGEIESILKFSYDALCDEDKDLFLHIACVFNNQDMEKVEEHLAESLVDVRQGLHVLAEKSLISIDHTYIKMHNLLAQLGQEIVRQQAIREPRRRQFLVDAKDICEVLTDYTTITRSVIGINFTPIETRGNLNVPERCFEGMPNLQFFRFSGHSYPPNILSLSGRQNYISPKLRLLHWKYCPMTYLPFMVNPEYLVELSMVHSKLEKLWEGIKLLSNLKWMNLSYSENLKELPNLSTAINLKELILEGCISLVTLPSSIENASNLKYLNLKYCSSLVELPFSIGNATNLQKLNLTRCTSLVELPFSIGNVTNLQNLNLDECTSLAELPFSIGNVTNLQKLYLIGCTSLVKLPSSIGNATNLQKLYLIGCTSLVKLPSSIGNAINLQELHLAGCTSLVKLPSSLGNATNLQILDLGRCLNLFELPFSIGNATNLQDLNLRHCSNLLELPSSIGHAINLQKLDISYCSSQVIHSSIGYAINLKELYISHCSSLVKLPFSIENATYLQSLDLSGCSRLVEVHSSIGNATSLQYLNMNHCSSLLEIPSSIGNLHKLLELNLRGCLKLEVFPTNIDLKSLITLDLTDCFSLKSFPEVSTNIAYLYLKGTSIEEVPSSIRSWSRLEEFHMSYFENLKNLQHALDSITDLQLTNTEIQELGPWIKGFSRLLRLVLNEMNNLVSLPQLPDSLMFLDAENCESLERLDCSFSNPDISLDFLNCFRLNQDARDLIIRTSNREVTVLPGEEVPSCFTYRASGSSVIVKLNEKYLRTSTKFRACILLVNMGVWEQVTVYCIVKSKQNALKACRTYKHIPRPIFSEHLYIFDFEASTVTSTDLVITFKLTDSNSETISDIWEIKECGILQLLDHRVDEDSDEKICERRSSGLISRGSKRRRL